MHLHTPCFVIFQAGMRELQLQWRVSIEFMKEHNNRKQIPMVRNNMADLKTTGNISTSLFHHNWDIKN